MAEPRASLPLCARTAAAGSTRAPARRRRGALALAATLAALGATRAALADEATCDPASRLGTCIDADTLWPHAGAGRFHALGATETVPKGRVAFGLVTTLLTRPIVLSVPSADPAGTRVAAVDRLVDASFLWAIGVHDRVELTAAVPTTLYRTGTGTSAITSQTPEDLSRSSPRDARFGAAWALVPRERSLGAQGLALALRGEASAPIGDEHGFSGDRGWVGVPSAALDLRRGRLTLAAELGARLRKASALAGASVGSQAFVGAGVAYDLLGERLGVEVEAVALPTFSAQSRLERDPTTKVLEPVPTDRRLVPAEWMASVRTAPTVGGDFSAVLGVGGPIPTSSEGALTAPSFRTTLGLRWAPLGRDSDHDGVEDADDRCPGEVEDKDAFEDDDGCPDLDNDKDGIADTRDRCRDEAETFDGFEDEDGCPDLDDDRDGVPDELDRCRMIAEDRDGFEDDDGCPDLDNDKDGIPDAEDRCPNAAEDKDGYQDGDGCPDPDDDLDGVADAVDQCPRLAEDKDGFRDDDGCPDPDDDEDGVFDGADRCPKEPETIDGVADDDGCPEPGAHDLVVFRGDAVVLERPARFARGSAKLGPELLRDVAMVAARAKGRAPLARVVVEVYADARGESAASERLAGARSDALKRAFVEAGLPSELLTVAVGDLGAKRPAGAMPYDVRIERKR